VDKKTPNTGILNVGPEHFGQDILCIDHLSFCYPGGAEALRNIDLHVERGSTLAIVGPNGAGKTTLLKIVLGLLEGYTGNVQVAGLDPVAARRKGTVISWVPQRSRMIWDFPVTVKQVVRMGLVGKTGPLRRHARDDLCYVDELMGTLDIAAVADRPIGAVSGGQQQRAILARALAPRPLVLMLDEPTVGVDQAGLEVFATLMDRITRQFGITLVIVSHDLRTVIPQCQRIACLNQTLHFHDSPSRLTTELLSEVFRCDLSGLYAGPHLGRDAQHDHDDDHDHDHDHYPGPSGAGGGLGP
jgi:zinc transport system ATP-binding protein